MRQSVGIVWAGVVASAVVGGGCQKLERSGGDALDRVWVGPMPFTEGRTLRGDWLSTISDAGQWPEVLAQADVLKSYIMVLPSHPVPGKEAPELSDTQLISLALFVRQHGLRVAFEVGGLRRADGERPTKGTWGRRVAETEFSHLKRWLDAGGRIDYLTTDHAVMMNLGHHCYQGDDCGLSLEETIEELVDYFAWMGERIPGVRLGVIESLGFFHVKGPDGREYPRTVPKLPVWHFESTFDRLVAAMGRRGLRLDHFHVDFGFMGVAHDGRVSGRGGLDFGRVLGVEAYVRSKGVNAGVIVNAFHNRTVENPEPDVANREAYERTLRFFDAYVEAGGKAEHVVVQTWHPFPDRTGPERERHTVLGIARDIVRGPKFVVLRERR